jgi:NADP-dependent 3-hydroxy acid dehydrogenase YdfG
MAMSDAAERDVFLITGASSGIGAATAKRAVEAGYRVVLVARSEERLNAVAAYLGDARRVLPVACDVGDWDAQKRMVTRALEHFGRIDAVFANAGAVKGSPFFGGSDAPEEWREMVLTNVLGVAISARLTLPELVRRKGHFLMTGSAAGRITTSQSLYGATKWAVTGMAQAMRNQLIGTGVRVTLIQPGFTRTSIASERPATDIPRLDADDVARAVMYAVSQPASVDVNEILIRPVGQAS